MKEITATMENYLEAVYVLSMSGKGARVSDIANRLGVTKASTNSAMATLASRGLIQKERYREVYLTEEGRRLALNTSKKHHVIEQFFVKVLGIDPGIAAQDACGIEHVISGESVRAMLKYMSAKMDGNSI